MSNTPCPWPGCTEKAKLIIWEEGLKWFGCRRHLMAIAQYLRNLERRKT